MAYKLSLFAKFAQQAMEIAIQVRDGIPFSVPLKVPSEHAEHLRWTWHCFGEQGTRLLDGMIYVDCNALVVFTQPGQEAAQLSEEAVDLI